MAMSGRKGSKRTLVIAVVAAITLATAWDAEARNRSAPPSEPQAIADMVRREALNLGVSVPLALAVARAESNFDATAESHKGARGVMQIMPATGRWLAKRLGLPRYNTRIQSHHPFQGSLRYHD